MTAVLFISMVILLFAGVPIAFVLGGSSVLALAADSGTNMSIVIQRMFSGTGSFTLLAIPFFVLAGNLMSSGGISRRLVNLCNSFLGHIPGGLAMVAVATCAYAAGAGFLSGKTIRRGRKCRSSLSLCRSVTPTKKLTRKLHYFIDSLCFSAIF